jgi:hypothetical protein
MLISIHLNKIGKWNVKGIAKKTTHTSYQTARHNAGNFTFSEKLNPSKIKLK